MSNETQQDVEQRVVSPNSIVSTAAGAAGGLVGWSWSSIGKKASLRIDNIGLKGDHNGIKLDCRWRFGQLSSRQWLHRSLPIAWPSNTESSTKHKRYAHSYIDHQSNAATKIEI
jgi:hypothetical protein